MSTVNTVFANFSEQDPIIRDGVNDYAIVIWRAGYNYFGTKLIDQIFSMQFNDSKSVVYSYIVLCSIFNFVYGDDESKDDVRIKLLEMVFMHSHKLKYDSCNVYVLYISNS